MPSPAEVTDQLTDICVRVLGVDPAAVQPDATFKSLGADSLTIVEIGEELGRCSGVYLRDETIDQLRTVKDAVTAVTRHDGSAPGRHDAPVVPATMQYVSPASAPVVAHAAHGAAATRESDPVGGPIDPDDAWKRAKKSSRWLIGVGGVIGVVVGMMFALLMAASGLDDVSLPPMPQSTVKPTPTEEPEPEETEAAPVDEENPEPTLVAESDRVAPGERFALAGRFPELDANQALQIQVKEPGTDWEDFPVVSQTKANGEFRSEIYTSRTGEREFRLVHEESNTISPTVKVTIG